MLPISFDAAWVGGASLQGSEEGAFVCAQGVQDALCLFATHLARLYRFMVLRSGRFLIGLALVKLFGFPAGLILLRIILFGVRFLLLGLIGGCRLIGRRRVIGIVGFLFSILLIRGFLAFLSVFWLLLWIVFALLAVVAGLLVFLLLLLPDAIQEGLKPDMARLEGQSSHRGLFRNFRLTSDVQLGGPVIVLVGSLRSSDTRYDQQEAENQSFHGSWIESDRAGASISSISTTSPRRCMKSAYAATVESCRRPSFIALAAALYWRAVISESARALSC